MTYSDVNELLTQLYRLLSINLNRNILVLRLEYTENGGDGKTSTLNLISEQLNQQENIIISCFPTHGYLKIKNPYY